MKITEKTLPWCTVLQAGGLNAYIRGWNRCLRSLFPIRDQSYESLEVMYRGHPYVAAPRHYVDWQVLTTGGYETNDLTIIKALCRDLKQPLILDLGANVGHHSFVFATFGWRVMAFEPNPSLWPIIERKILRAALSNIQLNKVGLGDKDEVLGFRIPDASNSGTGHFVPSEEDESLSEVRLPIRHGDNYLSALGVNNVDIIKMDIQGFEPQALKGLRETMERCRPILCVEIGSENRKAIPTLESLAALLPEKYLFRYSRENDFLLFRRFSLDALSREDFAAFDGNVFCIPEEGAARAL